LGQLLLHHVISFGTYILGVEEDHINIRQRSRSLKLMEMIPNQVPNDPSPNEPIWWVTRTDGFQNGHEPGGCPNQLGEFLAVDLFFHTVLPLFSRIQLSPTVGTENHHTQIAFGKQDGLAPQVCAEMAADHG
jgi:hypothetical protein